MPEPLEVRNGAARLFARLYGRGRETLAVVMVPSLGRSGVDYDRLGHALAVRGYTAASFDPRGVRDSTGPLAGLDMADLASDAMAVARAVDAGRVVAIGHGFGNGIARRMAALYPDDVAGVVAINAGGKIHDPDPRVYAEFDKVFDPGIGEDERRAAISFCFFGGGPVPQDWIGGWWLEHYRPFVAAQDSTPMNAWWTAGQAPVLVIQGLRDRVAPPENGYDVRALAGPRAAVLDLPNASHAILPEEPEAVERAVLELLEGLRSDDRRGCGREACECIG